MEKIQVYYDYDPKKSENHIWVVQNGAINPSKTLRTSIANITDAKRMAKEEATQIKKDNPNCNIELIHGTPYKQ